MHADGHWALRRDTLILRKSMVFAVFDRQHNNWLHCQLKQIWLTSKTGAVEPMKF